MASGSSRSPTVQSANTDSHAAPNPTAADERLRRTPLWKYVKVIQKNSTTGGNARSECLFCGHVIPGSYFRVRAHLLKESNKGTSICSAVNDELLEELRKEDAAAKAAEASSQNRSVPMPIQIPFADSSSALPPQGARSAKRKKQSTIADGFHLELRRMADAIIARLFYTGGSPLFSLSDIFVVLLYKA